MRSKRSKRWLRRQAEREAVELALDKLTGTTRWQRFVTELEENAKLTPFEVNQDIKDYSQ